MAIVVLGCLVVYDGANSRKGWKQSKTVLMPGWRNRQTHGTLG